MKYIKIIVPKIACGILISIFLINPETAECQQSLPQVSAGRMVRVEQFQSQYISSRNFDIWLPPAYDSMKTYPVLYMHDGQMLFDSMITWNHQSWEMDREAGDLIQQNLCPAFIIVGIWNGGVTRHSDYFPQKPFESLRGKERDSVNAQLIRAGKTKGSFQPKSDAYLKFIVTELKPYIDQHFAVYTDSKHTYMAGSSMGGLISIYALCEYPDIFGGVACLSTHWPGSFTVSNNPFPKAFCNYLKAHLPDSKTHKIYMDHGDQTLDSMYQPLQRAVNSIIRKKGYHKIQFRTETFHADHSEKAWSTRIKIPMLFLFVNSGK